MLGMKAGREEEGGRAKNDYEGKNNVAVLQLKSTIKVLVLKSQGEGIRVRGSEERRKGWDCGRVKTARTSVKVVLVHRN